MREVYTRKWLDEWWAAILTVLAILLGPVYCHADEPEGGTTKIEGAELQSLNLAIRMLDLKAEADLASADAKTHDLGVRLKAAIESFEKVNDAGHVRQSGSLSKRTGAITTGSGEVAQGGAGDNFVVISTKLLQAASDPCSKEFLQLTEAIAHEGTHLNQVGGKEFPPAAIGEILSGRRDPSGFLEYKLRNLKDEIPCYQLGRDLYPEYYHQFAIMDSNVDLNLIRSGRTPDKAQPADMFDPFLPRTNNIPQWAQVFIDRGCPPAGIRDLVEKVLIEKLQAWDYHQLGEIDSLQQMVRNLQNPNLPPPMDTRTLVEWLDKEPVYKEITGEGGRRIGSEITIRLDSNSAAIFGENPDGCSWRLEPHMVVQDASIVVGASGSPFILVAGTDKNPVTLLGTSGIVRVFPVPDGAPTTVTGPPDEQTLDVPFEQSQCTTLTCAGGTLHIPSSILIAPDGRTWIWDVGQAALFRLIDDDSDGIPDRIDPHNEVEIPRDLSLVAADYASLKWYGPQPILELRVKDALDHGKQFVMAFQDQDVNGTFHRVTVTDWRRLIRADMQRR